MADRLISAQWTNADNLDTGTTADLISRSALLKMLKEKHWTMASVKTINDAPTVDAVPVKRGRWINERVHNLHNGEQRDARECSECGAVYFVYDMANALDEVPRYCPNCGAKMEGVIEDATD